MLKINLLPLEMRGKKEIVSPVFLFKLGGLFLILLMIISLIIAGVRWQKKLSYQGINRKWASFFQLENKNRQLETEKKNLERYLERKIFWDEKFDLINRLIPSEIWLTKLYWGEEGKEKKFIIEGQSLSLKQGAIENIIKFMNGLKNNKDFFSGFKKMELITQKENEATMGFKISCKPQAISYK